MKQNMLFPWFNTLKKHQVRPVNKHKKNSVKMLEFMYFRGRVDKQNYCQIIIFLQKIKQKMLKKVNSNNGSYII